MLFESTFMQQFACTLSKGVGDILIYPHKPMHWTTILKCILNLIKPFNIIH